MKMMNHCLMNPIPLSWDEFMCLSEKNHGIVFLNIAGENAAHFIIDLVLELEREKIVPVISPCAIFERSYSIDNASRNQKDLLLLLKSMEGEALERLNHWINRQMPGTVISLSDYIAEYSNSL